MRPCGALLLPLLLRLVISRKMVAFKSVGPDQRYVKEGTVVKQQVMRSELVCSADCGRNNLCLAFNFNAASGECELLSSYSYKPGDAQPVSAAGWKHFITHVPDQVLEGAQCPLGSVLLKYDQPASVKYDLDLPGYTCSDHTWLVAQHAAGKTDCRLTIIYDREFYGYDPAGFPGGTGPYQDILAQCLKYSCVAMVCINLDKCWIKYESHLTVAKQLTIRTYLYWYADCQ